MRHDESQLVKSDDVRPAITDRPDRCGYCTGLLGEQHEPHCMCRKRTVIVRASIEYCIEVPESWDAEQVRFHRNESTWCGSNGIEEIDDFAARMECICPRITYEFVREATAGDEAEEKFAPREPENDDVKWMGRDGQMMTWRAQRIDQQ